MSPTKKPEKASNKSNSYAIVEASGRQYKLEVNRYYDFNRLPNEVDENFVLDKVLLTKDGDKITIGKPYVTGAKVEMKVLEHRRDSKIIVYKMLPKKKTRRKNGHRQELTRVIVKSIAFS